MHQSGIHLERKHLTPTCNAHGCLLVAKEASVVNRSKFDSFDSKQSFKEVNTLSHPVLSLGKTLDDCQANSLEP